MKLGLSTTTVCSKGERVTLPKQRLKVGTDGRRGVTKLKFALTIMQTYPKKRISYVNARFVTCYLQYAITSFAIVL